MNPNLIIIVLNLRQSLRQSQICTKFSRTDIVPVESFVVNIETRTSGYALLDWERNMQIVHFRLIILDTGLMKMVDKGKTK